MGLLYDPNASDWVRMVNFEFLFCSDKHYLQITASMLFPGIPFSSRMSITFFDT